MADPLRPTAEEALAAWAQRVRANREQVERYQEAGNRGDRYAPIAARFALDPRRTDDPAAAALQALVQPDDVWLDVGAGGGRYALPLTLRAREVIALDQSESMLDVLRAGMAEYGIANVRVVQARWPIAEPPAADVALIAHVGYDIENMGPFLDAMERAARRACVALLAQRRPTWVADQLWPAVHGVERAALPALPEFLALLLARRRLFEVRLVYETPQGYASFEQALTFARLQTWVQPGSAKDERLRAALAERLSERNGRLAFDWAPVALGVVTWQPEAAPA
ncbi:MAG TPA: methyltransferase domain-containing protein [Chloroflexota bacterium]|nr:methyltransferase domain-containing protein [Chloroflexota bacterium]